MLCLRIHDHSIALQWVMSFNISVRMPCGVYCRGLVHLRRIFIRIYDLDVINIILKNLFQTHCPLYKIKLILYIDCVSCNLAKSISSYFFNRFCLKILIVLHLVFRYSCSLFPFLALMQGPEAPVKWSVKMVSAGILSSCCF